MTGCTINIAEFRCRVVDRATSFSTRNWRKLRDSSADRVGVLSNEREMEQPKDDPTIYDIGVAREAQRERHRTVFRPISIQRKANVLRFGDEALVRVKVLAEDARGGRAWSKKPDGPCDFPPAA